MKKKVFSLMMTLLLAFVGVAKAEVVTIGDGTTTTYVTPYNSLWGYSFVEQVYTADEIGTAGTITAISFNLRETDAAQTNAVDVFMKNVSRTTFSSVEDYEPVTASDMVFSGTVTFSPGWTTITLDTPFQYDGTSNLMIGMHEYTQGYSTRYFYYTSTTDAVVTFHSDGANPDPYNLDGYTGNKYKSANRANIQIEITAGGGGGQPANLIVHDGTTTNSYVPAYGFYADAYLKCEMVYPAAELSAMSGGTINGITFYTSTPATEAWTSTWQVFMSEVSNASINDFYGPGTVVYEGLLDGTGAEMTINFTTPYQYNGGNLLVGVYNITTGNYKSVSWYGETVDGASVQGYNYSSLSSITPTQRNFLPKTNFDYTTGGGSSVPEELHVAYFNGEEYVVDELNMGTRPDGAWMEPFNFKMFHSFNRTIEVSEIDFTPQGIFSVSGEELPFSIPRNDSIDLTINVEELGQAGLIEVQMVGIYGTGRTAAVWPLTLELYTPAIPDVWELACEEATSFPFVEVPATAHNTTLHNDYTLPFPEIPEGYDAVYKLVFDNDIMLNAEVTEGNDGKVALYAEDFYGEGGPMAHNYYCGPQAGGGAAGAPFEVQIGEGTTTTGYFPFYTLYNYSIAENLFLATELAEAGVTTAPMTSLSWYATNAPGYNQQGITIWMANVEDAALTTTSHIVTGMTKVYTGAMTPAIGWNEFVFNEGTFAWDGHSNVLIYCQRNNGEWNSTVSWQATGSMPFTCMAYRYQDSGAYDPTIANTMYTSSIRPNIIMKAGRGRDTRDEFVYGFEGGMQGWTSIDNDGDGNGWFHSSLSETYSCYDYTGWGNNESDGFAVSQSYTDCTYDSYDADNYLVSPQKYSLETGANLNFYFDYANDSYPDYFEVCVSTANNPSAGNFTSVWNVNMRGNAAKTGIRHSSNRYYNWREVTVDLSAYVGQEVWIAFHHEDYDEYELFIDDVTINTGSNSGSGGGGSIAPVEFSYGPVITNAPVLAGTYYLVASSTDADFEVTINAEDMPCPEVEGFAYGEMPADNEDEIEPASVTLKWNNPAYATECQVILGTTYHPEPNHPQTVISDWMPVTGTTGSFTVRNLFNNTNYFWHVVFRNGGACPEGVSGPVWGFTTHLNIPQNLTAVDYTVFDDETIVLNWNAVQDRTYRQYYIYRDGVKVGETAVNQINATTYTDGPLAYNMGGYTYYVTAVYDEGESAPSNTINVKVSGYGDVNGHVYEQDGETGIAGATVTMVGTDEFNVSHTYNFQTNSQGYYTGHIYAGEYNGSASCNGYQNIDEPVQGNPIAINYSETTSPIDYMLDENYEGPCTVIAEYYPDSLDPHSPYVKVYWGCGLPGEEIIEPFETGDFSLFDWQLDPTYPWVIDSQHAYEGNYCMKSGNQQVLSSTSTMQVTVNIPADGLMSFFGKISCESGWDYGYFYIDGVQKGSYTGEQNWAEKKFDITAGDHTFKWEYTEDFIISQGDDCFYVDYITFYKRPEPAQPGWHTYCESEFNNAVGSNLTTTPSWAYEYPTSFLHTNYAGWQITKVSLFSDNMYSAVGGNYTCRIYVGGSQPAAGTMVSELTVDVPSNQNAWVDWDLPQAVNVTGNDPIYVVWTANTTVSSWPAGCCGDLNDYGTWWDGGNGWEHLTYGTWTMRHWFTNRAGRSVAVGTADNVYNVIAEANPMNSKLRTYVKGEVDNTTVCANPNAVKGAALENGSTRAFAYYRIYRTDCYNDGPYTEENTLLLASEVVDTVYIDVDWPDAAPGIYKWGVGCVYSGNRGELVESPIAWTAPTVVRDVTADNTTNPVVGEPNGIRAPWDLMMTFTAPEGGHYGVAYDGNNFYTSNWGYSAAAYNFYKYDLSGNMLEGFNISGCGTLRGMTYDGQYFYGVANSATVYCVDLANHSVVSTFTSAYGAQRGITYDPQRDGFWVIGNWSGNLTLIDRTGAIQFTGPAPTSASDLAYYKDENDVEHIYCFNNGTNDVEDYNITTNTMGGSVFNFNAAPGATGTSGGCTVADFNGKTAFIGDLQQTPNLIAIYELKDAVPGGGGGGQGGNSPIQEERESEIVWSNCLEKDMMLDSAAVTVTVLLNSADSPEGVEVSFENYNELEQQLYPMGSVVLDESGYYAFPEFRKGEYQVTVEFDGYETIIDSVSIWDPTDLRYVMIEIIYGANNVYVSRTGWAMWEGHGAQGGGGGGQGGNGDTFSVNFDDSQIPAGWTTIDGGSPAGYGWQIGSTKLGSTGNGHNGSADLVLSQSYDNNYGVVYPDNWLISPAVTLGSTSQFSFWACGQDSGYANEHCGVFVSTTGTNPSDFQLVAEWTLTAKGEGAPAKGNRSGRAQGNWYQKTVDLGAYAGSGRYIAIRHFNCSDMFYLDVDDIELTNGAKGDRHLEYYKVMCTSVDNVPIFNENTVHPFCQVATDELTEGEHYFLRVACVYSTGMSAWSDPVEWEYEPCDHYTPVEGLEVTPENAGNHLTWEFEGGGGGGGQGGTGDEFSVNFDDSQMPAGWTVIDGGSPAGYGWQIGSTKLGGTGNGHNGSADLILSQSYDNNYGVVYPDNWFISPAVTLANGSTFSFWACGQDSGYANEHCGVFVSTTGTNPSDFQLVDEWTLTAKGEGAPAKGNRSGRAQGNWYQKTVDLSAYAGSGRYIAIRHFNCSDMFYLDVDDIELTNGAKNDRAAWDLMMTFNAAEAGHYGVAYDGTNFYTSNWGYSGCANNFYKYDLSGNMLEGFNISGCGTLRGITYDGTNFYGVANSATVYCVDLANHTVISTFSSSYGAMRGITYDPERDGFWVIGNWSGNLTLIDRAGAIQFTGPAPESASDLAYYKDENDVEHVFCFNNGTNDVVDYNITTNTLGSSVFNFSNTPGYDGGSSGGCTVGSFNGKIAFIGNLQQDPNLIGIYELREDNGGGQQPPTPVEGVIGFMVFRDGEWLAEILDPNAREYTDGDEFGEHEYCVRVIYDGTAVLPSNNFYYAMSCPVCEGGGGGQITCDAGADIGVRYEGATDEVTVYWGEQIVPLEEWLYYDDGTNVDAIGLTNGGSFYWGIMIPAASLAPYEGTSLTKVAYFDYSAHTGTIRIYQGGATAPATQVYTQAYTANGTEDWVEWNLTTPVALDVTQNLWIVLNNNDGQYVASCCNNTGDANGRWISLDGTAWEDVASYGLNNTWNLRGFVTNMAKGGEAKVIEFVPQGTANAELGHSGIAKGGSFTATRDRAEIVKYNVYRSTDNETYEQVGEVAAVAGQTYYEYTEAPATGHYYYQVRAYYDNDCESEPALRIDAHQYNYVEVQVTGVIENNGLAIYPNPTKGNVTIEANGMQHITVVSTLGQVVFDADVDTDHYILNMSQYTSGMYTVRVMTENGVRVERISVVK